jgi:acyl-CoA reductase-like NAD-dependent aldehyde dehydrogenase/nicotinamidase-related amidase
VTPALLLIDLQNDFLRAPSLEPTAGPIVDRAAALLTGCRARDVPVIHVWTTVRTEDDRRMPHWQHAGKWECVEGTDGHATPAPLRPIQGEPVIHKQFFSAFSVEELDRLLETRGIDTLLLAGVHLHGCVRSTALDAYQRRLTVRIAEDAVGSDDPLHAAITQRYLESRAARFHPSGSLLAALDGRSGEAPGDIPSQPVVIAGGESAPGAARPGCVHHSPRQTERMLWRVPIGDEVDVTVACAAARRCGSDLAGAPVRERAELLQRLADRVEALARALAEQMAQEIGKPVTQARAEVARGAALLRAAARRVGEPLDASCGSDAWRRYRPIGVVGLVTPWNNPLAIPLGKLAPALLYGNTVVWKPAPAGTGVAVRLMELMEAAGWPTGAVNLVTGDRSSAFALMSGDLDAVSLTGSTAAGRAAQDLCGRRHLPLQAELGGNNAAIVWTDSDLADAARRVAEGAFGFAGQRCTANRRVIIEAACYDRFLEHLEAATAALAWGDPCDPRIQVGPLISEAARAACTGVVARARETAQVIRQPHAGTPAAEELIRCGAYYPPTLIGCEDPRQEVIQEETFGPVLVVQRASDWEHAMSLCNGVRHGLVAALFSSSRELQRRFLEEAQAGILKLNQATSDAAVEAPFGGWKASGIGPPEHSDSNREFYTRTQAVYGWKP